MNYTIKWAALLSGALFFLSGSAKPQTTAGDNQEVRVVLPIGHTEFIRSCGFSQDGRFIITCSLDKNMILWDVKTGYELRRYQSAYAINKAVFSPDMTKIFTVGWDGRITERMLETTETLSVFGEGVNCIVYDSASNRLYSDSKQGLILVFDATSHEQIMQIKAHSQQINEIQLSPDGKYLASASNDGSVKLWNPANGKIIQEFNFQGFANDVCFSSASDMLACCSSDGMVKFFSLPSYALIREVKAHDSPVSDVCFSHDMQWFSTSGMDGKLKIWSLKKFELIHEMNAHNFLVYDAEFSTDDRYIATCGTDKTVKLWDVKTGSIIRYYTGHIHKLSGVDVCENTGILMAGHWDQMQFDANRAVFWDMGNGALESTTEPHAFLLNAVAVNRDGTKAMSIGEDNSLKFWSTPDAKLLGVFSAAGTGYRDAAFYPDGNHVAVSCSDGRVLMLAINDLSSFSELKKHESDVNCIDVSADGRWIASGDKSGNVIVWDASTLKPLKTIKAHTDAVCDVRFSPDAGFLVSASNDKTAAVWKTSTFSLQSRYQGHDWIVEASAISADNKYVYTVSWDRTIHKWDLYTAELISKTLAHSNYVIDVKLSRDGRYLTTASWDGSVKLWSSSDLKLLCTFLAIDDNDWIVVSADNYYMGSKDAAKLVSFSTGLNAYGFEQFDLQYNRPDKVLESLPGADTSLIPLYRKAYQKRLQKSGIDESYFSPEFRSPEITITNRSELQLLTQQTTSGIRIGTRGDVMSLHAWVNGVPCFNTNGLLTGSNTIDTLLNIPLSTGRNRIEIACMNHKGVMSLKEEVVIVREPVSQTKPDLYLISLAVSEYSDARYNLAYTINDGRGFIGAFTENNTQFANIFIDSLFNSRCTRENLEEVAKRLKNTHVDDVVIVHVAGHGLLGEDLEFYYALSSTDFKHPEKASLQYSQIEAILADIPSRNKLLLLDACHSGEVDEAGVSSVQLSDNARTRGVTMYQMPASAPGESNFSLKNSFDLMKELFVDVRRSTGAVVISAASGAGYAIERDDLKNGIFTWCLIDAITNRNADVDADGSIVVSELRKYIFQHVRELSEGAQYPTSRQENVSNDFRVW
ncbi:MAG TPA: WD40 repeat domain-containing protein [Bacteroidales bacterium]|nr:WD40 repeat domain-containing protein [Bacteroidales bacterium]